MSRYRLVPTPAQRTILAGHCAHARFIWNLAVEQQSWWNSGRRTAPGYGAQAAQLTEARAACQWLADGSPIVQQQALRDDSFGPLVNVGNITDGIFYANTLGVGLLVLSGGALTLSNFYNYGEPIGASTQWTFQTDNRFGPVGDFDGDGVNEIVVMSNSALGIVKFAAEWTPIVVVGNGVALSGGWRVDTTSNQFFAGGADGGQLVDPLMVVSPWGVGILQYQPAGPAADATLLTVFIAANGTALSVPAAFPPVSPWIVNTATDQFGPAWRDEIGNTYVLIRNDSAFGILSPRRSEEHTS